MSGKWNKAIAGLAGAAALFGSFGAAWAGMPAAKPAAAWTIQDPPADGADGLDRLIFKNGREVVGKILDETETTIRVEVHVAGLKAETTYPKSDILSIERGAVERGDKPADAPSKAKSSESTASVSGKTINSDTKKIYLIELKGEFGSDVSITPMEAVMKDAKREQPDFIVVKISTDYKFYGQEVNEDVIVDPRVAGQAYNQLETVRSMELLITDDIRDDPEWVKKPELVMWIDKALGGVAFLPWVSHNIYFTSNGRLGGMGGLEFIFGQMGDEVVREKQFSLRLARAKGLANKGGYDERLIDAMSTMRYVLSYRMEGGKAQLLEREPESPDEILLTDDGKKEEGRRDTIEDLARFQGNDVLTFDAALAERLGVSKGTVDTIDDLAYELGIERNYQVVDAGSKRILSKWSDDVKTVGRDFRRLWREYNRVQLEEPGGYDQRTAFRGTRIRILKQIKALLDKYKEAINPYEIEGAPENWISQLDRMIYLLEQEQRMDRRE